MRTVVTSLKSVKVALAATGIGLLIVALGSLTAFFKSSEDGANKLTKIMDVVGVVFGNVMDIIADFGGTIFDVFSKLLDGDFAGAWDEAGAGVDRFTESVVNFAEQTGKEIEQAKEVADLRAATDKLERKQLVNRARLESEIAINRLKSRQEEKFGAEERLEFLNNANSLAEELLATDLIIAKNRLKERRLTNSFSKSNHNNLQAEAEAEAAVLRIQGTRANQQRQIERERIRVAGQIRKELAATAKIQQAMADNFAEANEIADQRVLDSKIDLSNRIKKIEIANFDTTKAVLEARAELELTKNDEILTATAGMLGSVAGLLGQNSVFGKATAIAEATINSYVAGTKAMSTLPIPFNFIALATTIATGLATVKKIVGVQLPQVQTVESSFADGGHIHGPSHNRGGVNINAEGGEYIISKDRMRLPHVRRAAMALNNFKQSKQSSYALGGFVNQDPNAFMLEAIKNIPQNILVTSDLNLVQNQSRVSVQSSTL